eukprot:TRINITY_DN1213_c0_g1_i1.p1 TRINITY_DN1213_c0_g1~~TRINITY_DN1213_c0_g1_i1.p1  ORF type:complete len:477 (+),score=126.39 TRINITY_DN1213_c0_g1_i1:126-1433(+)
MKATFFCFVLLSFVLSVLSSDAPRGTKTLVLVDTFEVRYTHSNFLRNLQDRGYELTFALADDQELSLADHGDFIYDNIIILAPGVEEFGGSVTSATFVEFIDRGGNLLVATDSSIGDPIREIASECGVEFDEDGTYVIDHTNYDVSDNSGDHTLIVTDKISQTPVITGNAKGKALFRGVGALVNPENPLLVSVLTGSSTSYSYSPEKPISKPLPFVIGSETTLIAAFQARNNARAVFSGSVEFFSNQFFEQSVQVPGQPASSSVNKVLAEELTRWVFNERGVLRASNARHHQAGESETSSSYRIKDNITYSVEVEEFTGGKWVPYVADDIQLEFVMLDPYVRLNLARSDPNSAKYSVTFTAPDVYGVFTFKLDYRRHGYTWLTLKDVVPLKPFRHNDYERFIVAAYPYYASAFSSLAGLFIFSFLFLWHREKKNE